ncbi:MAG: glutamate synthase subunit beta [Verrucomicrobia bacterium]|nr:glutamate synthase subunit beta [Verrucomicrobiota bacterium]
MGKPTGFIEFPREVPQKRPAEERIKDYREITKRFPEAKVRQQAARCMDCGVPFCSAGCPLGNLIPDFNDLVYHGRWKEAADRLFATNNFPEFTGRLCPALCEEACVLGITNPAVTIGQIELRIVEEAFKRGWVKPQPPKERTGKAVAVIGSGPAGLSCAQQLNRAGHIVTVFERAERAGGLLRYGIPDFKLDKHALDRRLAILSEEGIEFRTGIEVGSDLPVKDLKRFDAVVVCIGSTVPRDLPLPGRELDGIRFAMELLVQQNEVIAGKPAASWIKPVSAAGRNVIIIGGGDTGADCVGTANRQGAKSVTLFELLPKPPLDRPVHQPWPYWPMRLRTGSSHEEGVQREWSVLTKEFAGKDGRVSALRTVNVEFKLVEGAWTEMTEIPASEREWPANLVLLALGFAGPDPGNLRRELGIELDTRGNVKTGANYATNVPDIFAAGDAHMGQSLVVWAISEGRECARAVDIHLMGGTFLPTKGEGDLPKV